MTDEKSIYDLKLHESVDVNEDYHCGNAGFRAVYTQNGEYLRDPK